MKALITGASSGIGRDIAKYLSSLGYDIIAVAKDKKKLEEVLSDIKTKSTVITLDLTKKENCIKLYEMTKDEKIDILINNAGFGDCGDFVNTDLEKELDMIDLNIKAYHILTKLFLKDFKERDYGRILNVASIAAFMPGPYMATYYSTKSYILNLSLAIDEELKQSKSKVKVSILCPGPVKTNFNDIANVKFSVGSLESDYVAKYAVDQMFLNKLIIIPGTFMKTNRVISKIAPTKWVLLFTSKIQHKRVK